MELQSVLGSKCTAEVGEATQVDVVMLGCVRQVLDWGGGETAAFTLNPAWLHYGIAVLNNLSSTCPECPWRKWAFLLIYISSNLNSASLKAEISPCGNCDW